VSIDFKRSLSQGIALSIIILLFCLQPHSSISTNLINNSNNINNTVLPGYLHCFIDYRTSNCDDCPPICLSNTDKNIIIKNNVFARNIDQIFEKSLRQISTVKAGFENNDTNTANIYLQSLLLKNQLNINELNLINQIIKSIQKANSTISLAKYVHTNLDELNSNDKSSPIAISILNITSKSIDLLINSDSILNQIQGYPNLAHDLSVQKKWITKIISNTIIGCEVAGISGCLMSSIFTTGI
jgi:hypothetical protein